jgi:Tfp pilus assembly protein PilE
MGQQQLLLIILGVIIVGIAVGVAISLFSDNSASSNRDAMATDLVHLAAKARHFYGRPTSMGGGGRSFANVTIDKLATDKFIDNANGKYSITYVDADSVVLLGVGKVLKPNGDSIRVSLTVLAKGPREIVEL